MSRHSISCHSYHTLNEMDSLGFQFAYKFRQSRVTVVRVILVIGKGEPIVHYVQIAELDILGTMTQ